ncbi:methylated-DNA--[protein]-cysteine S-methyltransferase [Pontibacter arcticus]|uniref:Methylated-DNA--protein-cysteine methyltransferase n=1 Tax=Pontibacter arcticus TaxID=2080288 RepID=A0A364RDV1_9BACT|nr:methylated-DNA--[protein]-cysteine S-methyltransferase [Pontibacter arcticus]RAU82346.1 cysteine methyltransferase [Pontibacter arcticus]
MKEALYTAHYTSPIGLIEIKATDLGITSVLFVEESQPITEPTPETQLPESIKACQLQLNEYFTGGRRNFQLTLNPKGTSFQEQVWENLKTIPFGKTASYMDVARATSGEKAIRAVGGANGRNPICIIVPCHRVIGSDGSLTGYAGKVWRKEWLLRHEGILKPETQLSIF